MNQQDYRKIAFESRGLDIDFDRPFCEICNRAYAVDTDHINSRGGKHNTDNRMFDPLNLILCCRRCHSEKGGYDWKEKAKKIVLSKLKK